MRYWLMKSEPDVFSIDDLENAAAQTSAWEGVRNYQARNFMRDDMKVGDRVLFYHSNCSPPGIAGLAEVVREAYPDHTSWDEQSDYYDPKSSEDKPRWYMVDVQFREKFPAYVSLPAIKEDPALKEMLVAKRGQRLSIQPVEKKHFDHVVKLGRGA